MTNLAETLGYREGTSVEIPIPARIIAPINLINDLLAVREAIGIEGNGVDMAYWSRRASCGTVCCIAGHLALLNGYRPLLVNPDWRAGEKFQKDNAVFAISNILGWTRWQEVEHPYGEFFFYHPSALWIFGLGTWPLELKILYQVSKVKAAQAAIDRFIDMYSPALPPQEAGEVITEKVEQLTIDTPSLVEV